MTKPSDPTRERIATEADRVADWLVTHQEALARLERSSKRTKQPASVIGQLSRASGALAVAIKELREVTS